MSSLLVTAATATDQVPWPWPLAPLFLAVLIGLGALVVYMVNHYVIKGEE